MPQPFEMQKVRDLKAQISQTAGHQANRYYPNINVSSMDLPEPAKQAFRQAFDNIYDTRANYTPAVVYVKGSGTSTVVTTEGPIGLGLQFTRQGRWIISANIALDIVSDSNQLFSLILYVIDNKLPLLGKAQLSGDGTVMISQNWLYTSSTGSENCKLYIVKAGGAGTSAVDLDNSTLTATWQGT